MIVLQYDTLEQFLQALNRRVSNELFSHIEENNPSHEESGKNFKIILQYLGRIDPALLVLHQCVIKIQHQEEKDQILKSITQAFEKAGGIVLIQGKIQELILSVA
jgi:hypothetical protein